MPRSAPRSRILSAGAGAAATVAALSLVLNPPSEVDPLGALGRANASAPAAAAPAAAPDPVPSFLGVAGVDLARLGYRGPDLEAVTLASLSAPFSALPTERAADIRDRINTGAPHLAGLHQAKNVLHGSLPQMDHHVNAAKVAVAEAEESRVGAAQHLAEVRGAVEVAPPPLGGQPGVAVVAQRIGATMQVEQAAAELAAAEDAVAARQADLDARRARRQAVYAAAALADHETWRIDAHLRWLEYELWLAQAHMPSAANWLVLEERKASEVPIVTVRGIRVHRSLADSVRQLVDAAATAGIDLRGTAYRPVSRQIELRRQNCGTSEFDIYEKSPSLCSPPTAKPGRSLHETGLAVDLRNGANPIVSRRDPAFQWLAAHAPAYGLYNLAAEPWHWSATGQ